jgi:hypothetical protein
MRKPANPAALIYAKAITILPPPDAPKEKPFLVVHLIVDCPICGEAKILLAGHHLRSVVRTLQGIVDTVPPELTAEGETQIVERQFDRPFRPEDN